MEMYHGRVNQREIAAVQEEAVEAAAKWWDEFDLQNNLNDWVTYIVIYLARAAEIGKKGMVDWQYKAFIKAAGLCLAAATFVRERKRHYD